MIKKSILTFVVIIFLFVFYNQSYAISFTPMLSVSEEYNDNIYLASESGNQVEDWITIVSPGFALDAKTKKKGITLKYDFSHSSYSKNPENNSFRHNGFLDSWFKLSRHTELGLSNRYVQTEENQTEDESAGLRNNRNIYYTNSTTVDIDQRFGEKRSINIAYSYRLLENDDVNIEDNQSHQCSLSFKYDLVKHLDIEEQASYEIGEYDFAPGFVRIQSRTRLTKTLSSKFDVFVEYSHTDFKNETPENNSSINSDTIIFFFEDEDTVSNSDVTSDYETESYRVYNPSSGFNWTFEEGSTLSINAGYFIQERDAEENSSGLTIDADIGKQWRFKRGLINITGNSGYEDTQLQSENLGFNIYYQGAIRAQYSFTRTFQGIIALSYRYDNYINSASDQDGDDRVDENYGCNISASWRVMKWLNTNCSYSYKNRDSNRDSYDYVENKATLGLTVTPGSW